MLFFSHSYQSCFLFYPTTKENTENVHNGKRHTCYLVLGLRKGRLFNVFQGRKHRLIQMESTTVSAPKNHNATATKMPSSLRFLGVRSSAASHWLGPPTTSIASWSQPTPQFSDPASDCCCYCFNLLLLYYCEIFSS